MVVFPVGLFSHIYGMEQSASYFLNSAGLMSCQIMSSENRKIVITLLC